MGFILQFFNNERRTLFLILLVALMVSSPLEYSQKWIVDRYPDITDVLGALVGAFAGAIACRRGWETFREYLKKN